MKVLTIDALLAPRSGELLGPSRVLFGAGCSKGIGAGLADAVSAHARVMVIVDRAVWQRGLARPLLDGLRQASLEPIIFDGIDGEPDDATVDAAAAQARGQEVKAVVGIGGGSGMDTAKLVALLAVNEGRAADWVGVLEPPIRPTPLALVPTTTGTGGETTRIAMVNVGGAKRIASCRWFVPTITALDPVLVAALPAQVTASTALDALAHAIESMLSENRSTFTMCAATRACELIVDHLERAVASADAEARGQLLYAAYLAGTALNAGVVLGHSIGYAIARRAHASHGVTTGLVLPYCIAYDQGVSREVGEQIAKAMSRGQTTDLRSAAVRVDALLSAVGLPHSLDAVGIGRGELRAMAVETVRDYPRPNNPVPLEADRIERLLECMAAGDLPSAWVQMERMTVA